VTMSGVLKKTMKADIGAKTLTDFDIDNEDDDDNDNDNDTDESDNEVDSETKKIDPPATITSSSSSSSSGGGGCVSSFSSSSSGNSNSSSSSSGGDATASAELVPESVEESVATTPRTSKETPSVFTATSGTVTRLSAKKEKRKDHKKDRDEHALRREAHSKLCADCSCTFTMVNECLINLATNQMIAEEAKRRHHALSSIRAQVAIEAKTLEGMEWDKKSELASPFKERPYSLGKEPATTTTNTTNTTATATIEPIR
jgi:hypothetical protein